MVEVEKNLYNINKEAVQKESGQINEEGYFKYLENLFTKMSNDELLENYNLFNPNIIYLDDYNKFK